MQLSDGREAIPVTASTRGHVTVSTRGHVTVSTRGHVTVSTRGHVTVSTRGHVTVSTRDSTSTKMIEEWNRSIGYTFSKRTVTLELSE
jgi:hypothetical protein